MWDSAVTSKLSLTAAARLDHLSLKRTGPEPVGFAYDHNSDWDRTIDTFSANLGAVYRLSDLDTVRATFARGIQIPSSVEFGGAQAVIYPGPFPFTLGGNPFLRPTVVNNYQLSYDRSLVSLNAKVSVKAFFQQTTDIVGFYDFSNPLIGSNGIEATFANASNSTMAGFELAASGRMAGGFHWSADTTYTHVADTAIAGENLVTRQIAFGRTTPKFRGNVAAGWSDPHWAVDLFLHYVTAYDVDNNAVLEPTPAYASLAARVAYQWPEGWTVALSGQNLGAAQQSQGSPSGLQAPRRVILGLSKSW